MTRDAFDLFSPKDRGRFGDNESAPAQGRVSGDSDLSEIELVLHYDTAQGGNKAGKAILASIDGNENRAQWLPHSLIEVEETGRMVAGVRKSGQTGRFPLIKVTLPERLAREKGLI